MTIESRYSSAGVPVRIFIRVPSAIMMKGTMNEGEIIQAARRTP
jgi:hypothetical protein